MVQKVAVMRQNAGYQPPETTKEEEGSNMFIIGLFEGFSFPCLYISHCEVDNMCVSIDGSLRLQKLT